MKIYIDTKPKRIEPYDLELRDGSESFGSIQMAGTQSQGMYVDIPDEMIRGIKRRLYSKTPKGSRYFYEVLIPLEAIEEEHREYNKYLSINYIGKDYYRFRIDRKKNPKWKVPKFEKDMDVWWKIVDEPIQMCVDNTHMYCDYIIDRNPKLVEEKDYEQLLGLIMKHSKGKCNPKSVMEYLNALS